MIKIIDGKPVQVPDSDAITQAMKEARTVINTMLQKMQHDHDTNGPISRAYREGRISDTEGFKWFMDDIKKPD